jgi:hypothetical protein
VIYPLPRLQFCKATHFVSPLPNEALQDRRCKKNSISNRLRVDRSAGVFAILAIICLAKFHWLKRFLKEKLGEEFVLC